ncbi:MAG: diacylglycerol kinase family lipid kinase [Bacteroidetes bacterium]|nr:diacylglycerol kinase family lipid kinase [Bacteroidota bacterium]
MDKENKSSRLQTGKKKILFIVNPISGGKSSKKIPEQIRKGIDTNKYDFHIKYTEHEGHATTIANEAVIAGIDIIVAVGGDGTMNEVASSLIHSQSILGIIPIGSGNGLARHLRIPLSASKAIQLINKGHFQFIDTAAVNNKPFISIAGVGYDALIARKFRASKKRGFSSYLQIIAGSFLTYKPKKYKVSANGKTLITRALFISFANSNQFGYNAQIAPKARLNDGLLDICIAQKPSLFEMPLIANLVLLKMIDKSPYVNIMPAKEVIIERKKGKYVNIDGEALKMDKKLNVKVVPSSLKIIIPEYVKKEK